MMSKLRLSLRMLMINLILFAKTSQAHDWINPIYLKRIIEINTYRLMLVEPKLIHPVSPLNFFSKRKKKNSREFLQPFLFFFFLFERKFKGDTGCTLVCKINDIVCKKKTPLQKKMTPLRIKKFIVFLFE